MMSILIGAVLAYSELLAILRRVVVADSSRDTIGKTRILLKGSRNRSKNQHAVFCRNKKYGRLYNERYRYFVEERGGWVGRAMSKK